MDGSMEGEGLGKLPETGERRVGRFKVQRRLSRARSLFRTTHTNTHLSVELCGQCARPSGEQKFLPFGHFLLAQRKPFDCWSRPSPPPRWRRPWSIYVRTLHDLMCRKQTRAPESQTKTHEECAISDPRTSN